MDLVAGSQRVQHEIYFTHGPRAHEILAKIPSIPFRSQTRLCSPKSRWLNLRSSLPPVQDTLGERNHQRLSQQALSSSVVGLSCFQCSGFSLSDSRDDDCASPRERPVRSERGLEILVKNDRKDVRSRSSRKPPSGVYLLAIGRIDGRDAPTIPRLASTINQYTVGVKISWSRVLVKTPQRHTRAQGVVLQAMSRLPEFTSARDDQPRIKRLGQLCLPLFTL